MWSLNHPLIAYYKNLEPSKAPDKVIRNAAENYYMITRTNEDTRIVCAIFGQEIYISSDWYSEHFINEDYVDRIIFKSKYKYGRSIRSSDRYYSWTLDVLNWVVHYNNDGKNEIQTPEEHGFHKGDVITYLGVVQKKGGEYICLHDNETAILYRTVYHEVYEGSNNLGYRGDLVGYREYVIGSPVSRKSRIDLPQLLRPGLLDVVRVLIKGSSLGFKSYNFEFSTTRLNIIEMILNEALERDWIYIFDFKKIWKCIGIGELDELQNHLRIRKNTIERNLKIKQHSTREETKDEAIKVIE